MRVVSLLVMASVTLTISAEAVAERWDPLTSPGNDVGFAPMSTTTATSGGKLDDAEARPRRWYGGQTLVVDAISIGLVIGSVSTHSTEWSPVGIVGYVFGG